MSRRVPGARRAVPASDHAIYGQAQLASASTGGLEDCYPTVNGAALSANQTDAAGVTAPGNGAAEASVEAVAHFTAPGTTATHCYPVFGGSTTSNTTVMAIKVGSATP